ncbi:MAG: hypothetical protein ACK4PR_10595, partial [Gammaproteobacteria bacterium]
DANIKEDKEFKQHLQSLLEPGKQVTQARTQGVSPSEETLAFLTQKSPSFQGNISTNSAKGNEDNNISVPKTDSNNSPKPG